MKFYREKRLQIHVLGFFLIVTFVLSTGEVFSQSQNSLRDEAMRRALRERVENQKRVMGLSDDIKMQLDVPYLQGAGPLPQLDVYIPVEDPNEYSVSKKKAPYPVLFYVHGGSGMRGDKRKLREMAVFFAARKVVFVTPNYRVSPPAQHPLPLEDCAAALAWTLKNLDEIDGDKGKIFLAGHSAGAHLVALLATNKKYLHAQEMDPESFAGIICVDAPSMNLVGEKDEIVKRLIQKSFGTQEDVLRDGSPYYQVQDSETYPKFLIFNTKEREQQVESGKAFAEKLKRAGVKVNFVPVENHTSMEMQKGIYDPLDVISANVLNFMDL